MKTLIILIISILPVYIVGLYVYKKDREKEPKALLKKIFFLGMLSCIPAGIIEIVIEPFFGDYENMNLFFLFLYVSIGIAFVEEICKWFVVYRNTYNNKEFDHIYDALVYCTFVSLGFACLENILYVSMSGIVTGVLRAITAIPGHASDAIVMGNYLGLAKLNKINNNEFLSKKYLILSIVMPTIMHAIYDYCLFTGNIIFVLIFIVFIIGIYIYSIKKIKTISSVSENFIVNDNTLICNYCPNCGQKLTEDSNYCPRCGTNLNMFNKLSQ